MVQNFSGNQQITVRGSGNLRGIDVDMNEMPDAAMTLAVAALFAEGTTAIRNIYNWRLKETERLQAVSSELKKLGAPIEEGEITSSLNHRNNYYRQRSRPMMITEWLWPSHSQHMVQSPLPFLIHHV